MFLVSCGNKGTFVGSNTFEKVHIADHAGNCKDITVETWYNRSHGIKLETKECGNMFLSEGTYILYNGKCPLCGK